MFIIFDGCFEGILKSDVLIMNLGYKIIWHGLRLKTFQSLVEFSCGLAEMAKATTYKEHLFHALQFPLWRKSVKNINSPN